MSCGGPRGRPRDEETYAEFTKVPIPRRVGKSPQGQCNNCSKLVTYAVARLQTHLSKCESFRARVGAANHARYLYHRSRMSSEKYAHTLELLSGRASGRPDVPFAAAPSDASQVDISAGRSAHASQAKRARLVRGSDAEAVQLADSSEDDDMNAISGLPSRVGARQAPASSTHSQVRARANEPRRSRPTAVDVGAAVDRLPAAEKAEIDYAFAQAIHLDGLAFDALSTPAMQKAFGLLYPAFSREGLPSREAIAGPLLERHFHDVDQSVRIALVSNDSCGITSDGRSGQRSDGLHNLMVCFPLPFLFASERKPFSREDKTSIYQQLKAMVHKVRTIYEGMEKTPPKLIGVCTDSSNANRGARLLLDEDEEMTSMGVLTYGCACHAFNRLGNDLQKIGNISGILKKAKAVAQVFRDVRIARFHLAQYQRKANAPVSKIKVPVDTGWHNTLTTLESLQAAKGALLAIYTDFHFGRLSPPLAQARDAATQAGEHESALEAASILGDPSFWTQLDAVIEFLRPVALCVRVLESDMAPVSMISVAFIYLLRRYKAIGELLESRDSAVDSMVNSLGLDTSHFSDVLPNLVRQRWREITRHSKNEGPHGRAAGVLQLALFLDPVCSELVMQCTNDGIALDADRSVVDAIDAGLETMSNFAGFLEKDKFEAKTALLRLRYEIATRVETNPSGSRAEPNFSPERLPHPAVFYTWSGAALRPIARLIFRLPPSAAGGERSFKAMDHNHTTMRCRLGAPTLRRLERIKLNSAQYERTRDIMLYLREEGDILHFFNAIEPSPPLAPRDRGLQAGLRHACRKPFGDGSCLPSDDRGGGDGGGGGGDDDDDNDDDEADGLCRAEIAVNNDSEEESEGPEDRQSQRQSPAGAAQPVGPSPH